MGYRIPEGYVFVSRAEGVAAALLDAADAIKADRKFDVRTTQGGYFVAEAVAAKYQEKFPEAVVTSAEAPQGDEEQTPADQAPEVTETAGEATVPEQQDQADEVVQVATQEGADTEVAPVDDSTPVDEAEGPKAGWTHAQFDEWAGKQQPVVVFPKDSNLKQKLEIATKPADA